MKKWLDLVTDGIFRGTVALVLFYVLKQICLAKDFIVFAGVNPLSFLMVAILGIPGLLLVFAVGLIHYA